MELWLRILILAVLSYALGNWSMARMLAWRARREDISKKGSGNPGTMNMIRSYGYKKGVATLILDVIKGAVPALLGGLFLEYGLNGEAGFHFSQLGVYIGGLGVILGHMFPVVFKFKGGKGVACGIGVFLVADPLCMLAVFALAVIIFIIFEYGFVASLTCILCMTVIEFIRLFTRDLNNIYITAIAVMIAVIFLLINIAHYPNYIRLFKGTESKVSLRGALKKHKEKKLSAERGDAESAGAGTETDPVKPDAEPVSKL